MSQAFGSNYNLGSYNPYPNNSGNPTKGASNAGYMGGYNNDASPMFGPMQGGMGGNSFGSGSPSENYMDSLLNIGPLQSQVNQFTGGNATVDPSSPLAYAQNTLGPIMQGAEQTYNQAMGGNKKAHTGGSTTNNSSGNYFPPPTVGSQNYYSPTGGNPYSTGSASEDNMNNLLNIGPLESQVNQFTGGNAAADPSSPLAYAQNTLGPIMRGAEQTYNQAMSGSKQKSANTNNANTNASSGNSGSSNSSYSTRTTPSSIPLSDSGTSSSSGDSSSSSGSGDDGSDGTS